MPDDANGVPDEPTDVQKRDGYTKAGLGLHSGPPGRGALGATLFTTAWSTTSAACGSTWSPTRLAYYSVKKAFTGSNAGDNLPPVVSGMTVTPAGTAPAGGEFTVRADIRDPENDPVTNKIFLSGNYANGDKRLVPAQFRSTGNGTFAVTAPEKLGGCRHHRPGRNGPPREAPAHRTRHGLGLLTARVRGLQLISSNPSRHRSGGRGG